MPAASGECLWESILKAGGGIRAFEGLPPSALEGGAHKRSAWEGLAWRKRVSRFRLPVLFHQPQQILAVLVLGHRSGNSLQLFR